MKRWSIIPTLLVVLAVATMIGLGIWQLQRKSQKEALLARYNAAASMPAVTWPTVPLPDKLPLYRQSSVNCLKVVEWQSVSGINRDGKAGIAHVASCQTGGMEGPGARIALGWSERPENPVWQGGLVKGMIAPDGRQLIKLVATDPVAGLTPLAKPSPDQIPNNHLLYAIQWFFFASAAAIIYVLALRKRQQGA